MSLSRTISEAFAPLVDLVYPPRCPLCGDGLGEQSGLCLSCWETLALPREPSCTSCQRPLGDDTHEGMTCAACMQDPPKHDGIATGTIYNDTSRKLVLSFKHGRKIALAPMLAGMIRARLAGLEGEWLAVPVPLHRLRLWSRGFNQSALLARELAKAENVELVVDGLVRTKPTPSLGGLGKRERARALQGAISPHPKRTDLLKGANVLLVDDVLTSGETTNACVSVLRRAGAKRVKIACFSRVLDEAL
ncbi:ComF family protein [Erythrobacter sp. JGD-13]|uniref:ComF family protein n=2 Tax=Aurantiacibacter sediminis TaxID=2793064 RepID=A0ABS0N409_9SPHN|nr:ComF family protein [Aurantiacibacter sediminis]